MYTQRQFQDIFSLNTKMLIQFKTNILINQWITYWHIHACRESLHYVNMFKPFKVVFYLTF